MRWEHATAADLYGMIKEQVCIIPIGSLEKHGEHLPLGNDALIAHRIALMAAEREPCVVLPPLFFTYVKEMKNLTGAVGLNTDVLLRFLENLCDEVARNGFKKIVLLNSHGGNNAILKVFLQHLTDLGKDYAVFLPPLWLDPKVTSKVRETSEVGHACEIETSMSLYLFPDLCKMDHVPEEFSSSRMDYDVKPAQTSVDWFSSYPDAYVGDASKASAEKGKAIVEAQVEVLVQLIRKIKKDDRVVNRLMRFYELSLAPRERYKP